MTFIKSGQTWQFATESSLEEVVWRYLPELMKLKPISRQFCISGKFCDIIAVDDSNRLVIVELKNTEDRYVVQQLVRYYEAITTAETFPFDIDVTAPRLVALAPSFHADTLTDCKHSRLEVELMTFSLKPSLSGISLLVRDAAGHDLCTLPLQKNEDASRPEIQIPESPRKLLNWLSHSSDIEHEWVLRLRKQLLGFDPRMKEIIEPTRIIYGRGKSKPCCELKKNTTGGMTSQKISYFLWLPDPDNNPHVIIMQMNFDLEKQNVRGMVYGRNGHKFGNPWHFPECIERMKCFRYERSLSQYQPFLNSNMTISPTEVVNLAAKTWHSRW